MVGFLQTGHGTVEEVRVKLEKELFVYKPDGGWGRKRVLKLGWSGQSRCGKWGQGNWGAKFKTKSQAWSDGTGGWAGLSNSMGAQIDRSNDYQVSRGWNECVKRDEEDVKKPKK